MLRRDNLKLIIVATLCLVVGLTAPAVGHGVQHALFAHNADKVDGRHAVGSGASIAARKGKLVATNPGSGRLPDNIIAKAPNANLLDGRDSTAFLPAGAKAADAELLDGLESTAFSTRTAEPGQLESGIYAVSGVGGYLTATVEFQSRLKAPLPADHVAFVGAGDPPTTECPGSGQATQTGWLCVYEVEFKSRTFHRIANPAELDVSGTNENGFALFLRATATDAWSYGTWSVNAPEATPTAQGGSPQHRPGNTP